MPNIFYESLDSVPDDFKSIAKEVDGKFAINVVPRASVDEFRDTNIALRKERDDLVAKVTAYSGIVGEDLDGFTKNLEDLRTTKQRVVDGELKEGRQIEEALGKRTEELRKGYDSQVQGLSKELAAYKDRYATLDNQYKRGLVASAIKDACVSADSGVEPQAIEDIIAHAHGQWRVDDHGKIVAFDGEAQLFGSDGVNPMSPKEWVAKLRTVKPFFFKPTQGGGSGGDTTKKVHGYNREDISKMTAAQRLELANTHAGRRSA